MLICVLPNREQTDTDYQHSELYGLVPTDTLNSSPMEAMKSDWNDGFPTWFFVIEADQITEDYALQYGDFVLTGKDLLTNTWTIGNAPAMEW